MIFKTVKDDTTKTINSLSIFNSSFKTIQKNISTGQGLTYSIFSGDKLNKNDVQSITNYADALKNGSTRAVAWNNAMKSSSVAAKQYVMDAARTGKSTTEITSGLKSMTFSAKASEIAFKSLSFALNTIAYMAIILVISEIINQINSVKSESEKLTDELNKLQNEYDTLDDKITNINEKLAENQKRIKEIQSLDTLTYADEKELENLEKINQALEKNKEILSNSQSKVKEETIQKLQEKFDTSFTTTADQVDEAYNETHWYDYLTFNTTKIHRMNKARNSDTEYDKMKTSMDFLDSYNSAIKSENFKVEFSSNYGNDVYDLNNIEDAEIVDGYVEEYKKQLGDNQLFFSQSLLELQEKDPDLTSEYAKELMGFIHDTDKYLNYEQWLQDEINTVKNNAGAEIYNSISESIKNGMNISEEDLLSDDTYSKLTKNLAIRLYGDQTEESLKMAASYLIKDINQEFAEKLQQNKINLSNFFNEDNTKVLDNFQTNISSIGESISKINLGETISGSEMLDVIQHMNDISNIAGVDFKNVISGVDSINDLSNALDILSEKYVNNLIKNLDIDEDSSFAKMLRNICLESIKSEKALENLNTGLDNIQSAYSTIENALSEYNANGLITIDTFQSLIQLDDNYLQYLIDENGKLQLNTKAFKNLTLAKLEEAKATSDATYMSELQKITINNLGNELGNTNNQISTFFHNLSDGLPIKKFINNVSTIVSGFLQINAAHSKKPDKTLEQWQSEAKKINEEAYNQATNAWNARNQIITETKHSVNTDYPAVVENNQNLDNSSSSTFNYIDNLLQYITNVTAKIKENFDNAFSLKNAQKNFKKALKQISEEIKINNKAYSFYMNKANSIGIPKEEIQLIQKGNLNIKDYSNDTTTYDKIQSYQQWYEKAQACKDTIDSLRESEQSLKESYVDKITEYYDRKTKTYQNKIDTTNDLISMNEDMYGNASSSMYYYVMKNTSKTISVYRKELSTLQKKQKQVNKTTNPSLWYKYQDAIDEAKSSVDDLADSYLSLAKSKAEVTITKRDIKVEKLNETKSLNDSKINNEIGYSKKNAIVNNNIDTEKEILGKYKTTKAENTKVFKTEKKESSSKSFKNTLAKSGISNALIEKANNAVKHGKKIPAKVLNALKKNMSGNKNAENAYKQFLEYNTALNIKDIASSDYAKQEQESKSNIKQYQQQLLDNISQDFDLRIKAIQDKQSQLDTQNEIANTKGFDSSINYYKNTILNIQNESKLLKQEREKLKAQLNANQWNKYSEEYQNAMSSLNELDVQLKNNEKSQIAWNNAILQIPIEKLSKYLDLLESIKGSNQSMMEYYKSIRGYSIEADFKEQITDNEKEIKTRTGLRNLYQEYAAKAKERGEYGGKTYQQWLIEINNIDSSIYGLKTTNEELKDSLREEVYLKPYENLVSTSDNIIKNFENMESLLSSFDFTLFDDNGNLNEYGLAKLDNFVKQLDENKKKIAAISGEIKKIEELKKNREINEVEYLEKINELQPEYNSALLESANLIKSITDLMKQQAQERINYIKDQIEAYKKLLSTEKEENSYQKSIKEKTDNISALQKQLLALGNGSTEDTQAEYQKVLNELETAKDDLNETEWEHYIDLQIHALDDLSESLDDYLSNIDITLENILETLNNAKGIVADVDSSTLLNKILEGIGGNTDIFHGTSIGHQKNISVSKLDLIRWANNYSGGDETSVIKYALSTNDMDGLVQMYHQYENDNVNSISDSNNDDIRNYVAKILEDIVSNTKNVTGGIGYKLLSVVENTTLSDVEATNAIQEILKSMIYYSNTHGVPESQIKQFIEKLLPWLKMTGLNVPLDNLPGFSQGGIVEQVARNSDDGIVSLKATEAFLSENEIAFLKKIDLIHPIIPSLINDLSHLNYSLASTDSAQSNSIENVNINLECPAVTKEELYSWLQDTRTQKIIQSSVIDPIMGNGTFGRYQH